jgi:hypothetical protein
VTLRIKLSESNCQPSQVLEVAAEWDFESIPYKLIIEMLWQTSGKGSDDSETVFSETWSPNDQSGSKNFTITLPRGPISVRGNLISVQWQFKLTSKRPSEVQLYPFVLSHVREVVQLSSLVK